MNATDRDIRRSLLLVADSAPPAPSFAELLDRKPHDPRRSRPGLVLLAAAAVVLVLVVVGLVLANGRGAETEFVEVPTPTAAPDPHTDPGARPRTRGRSPCGRRHPPRVRAHDRRRRTTLHHRLRPGRRPPAVKRLPRGSESSSPNPSTTSATSRSTATSRASGPSCCSGPTRPPADGCSTRPRAASTGRTARG